MCYWGEPFFKLDSTGSYRINTQIKSQRNSNQKQCFFSKSFSSKKTINFAKINALFQILLKWPTYWLHVWLYRYLNFECWCRFGKTFGETIARHFYTFINTRYPLGNFTYIIYRFLHNVYAKFYCQKRKHQSKYTATVE